MSEEKRVYFSYGGKRDRPSKGVARKDFWLVDQYQIASGLHRGVIVESKQGKIQRQISLHLGENGRLMVNKGKLLAIRITEDGI